jgi:hypothetical protein
VNSSLQISACCRKLAGREDKIFVGISPALGKRPHLFTLDKAIWELAGGLRKEEFFHFLIIRLFDRLHLTKPLFWPFVFSSIMQLMNPSVACSVKYSLAPVFGRYYNLPDFFDKNNNLSSERSNNFTT